MELAPSVIFTLAVTQAVVSPSLAKTSVSWRSAGASQTFAVGQSDSTCRDGGETEAFTGSDEAAVISDPGQVQTCRLLFRTGLVGFQVFHTLLSSVGNQSTVPFGGTAPRLNAEGRKLGQCASRWGYSWPPARR